MLTVDSAKSKLMRKTGSIPFIFYIMDLADLFYEIWIVECTGHISTQNRHYNIVRKISVCLRIPDQHFDFLQVT